MQQSNALTNSSYIFLMSGCAHFSVASSSTSAASTTAVALCPAKHNNKSRAGQLHRKCSSKHYSLAARGVDGGGGAQEKEGTKPRRGRPRKVPVPCDDTPGLLQTIASRTQLPEAIVERVLAARSSTPGISSDADKLCHRIQHLQQLLGPDNANTALHRFPSLVAYRCVCGWVCHQSLCLSTPAADTSSTHKTHSMRAMPKVRSQHCTP